MQLPAAHFGLRCKDANLGHEVVMDLAFDLQRGLHIDLIRVRAQVVQLVLRHKAMPALRACKRNPHRAPKSAALLFGEQCAQFGATVSP